MTDVFKRGDSRNESEHTSYKSNANTSDHLMKSLNGGLYSRPPRLVWTVLMLTTICHVTATIVAWFEALAMASLCCGGAWGSYSRCDVVYTQ